MTVEHAGRPEPAHGLARRALFSFIVTFVLSRAVVFLIMSGEMPNLYFFLHGTHVHHLNYGIFCWRRWADTACSGGRLAGRRRSRPCCMAWRWG